MKCLKKNKNKRLKRNAGHKFPENKILQPEKNNQSGLKHFMLAFLLTSVLASLSFILIQLITPKRVVLPLSLIPDLVLKLSPAAALKQAAETKEVSVKVEFASGTINAALAAVAPKPVTGEVKENLSGEKSEFTFEMYNDEIISASTGLYSLRVCCPGGAMREYYTYPMDWEYILHKWSQTAPTVTLFQLNKESRQAEMQVVILKNESEDTGIRQADILRFIKSIDEKLPGYNWEADIRVEQ